MANFTNSSDPSRPSELAEPDVDEPAGELAEPDVDEPRRELAAPLVPGANFTNGSGPKAQRAHALAERDVEEPIGELAARPSELAEPPPGSYFIHASGWP